MKATLPCCAALLLTVAASLAEAQMPYYYPGPAIQPVRYSCCCPPAPFYAPGSGYYGGADGYSTPMYAPISPPPMPPFQGLLPAPPAPGGVFRNHPYLRSPRDYFMYGERTQTGNE